MPARLDHVPEDVRPAHFADLLTTWGAMAGAIRRNQQGTEPVELDTLRHFGAAMLQALGLTSQEATRLGEIGVRLAHGQPPDAQGGDLVVSTIAVEQLFRLALQVGAGIKD